MSQTPTPDRPATVKRGGAAGSGPRVPLFTIVIAAVLVVAIAVVVVVRLTGDDDGGDPVVTDEAPVTSPAAGDGDFGVLKVEGDPLPAFPGEGDDPAVGLPAPTLVGENPAGDAVTIDPADGPMVIAFVAHWCPHCQAEVPRIVDLVDGHDELDGVKLVAVATGTDPSAPKFPPGRWLTEEEWPAPVLLDTARDEAAAAYGLSGYPYIVAIDANGKVVARTSGEQGADGLEALFTAAKSG